jgi:hypothetical protein
MAAEDFPFGRRTKGHDEALARRRVAGPSDRIYGIPIEASSRFRACLLPSKTVRTNTEHNERDRPVPVTKLPGIVACTGAVVVASESSNPEALLTLKLTTESGDQVLLPLSERTTRQLQTVISEFNRTRDLLFVEERPSASATLQ